MRKMTAENMYKKPVINTNPCAFMECLHPISCVGYIQYTVDKVQKKSHMFLLFMLYFLEQQNLSHYLNAKISLLRFRIPCILDAIKGTDLKSETRQCLQSVNYSDHIAYDFTEVLNFGVVLKYTGRC